MNFDFTEYSKIKVNELLRQSQNMEKITELRDLDQPLAQMITFENDYLSVDTSVSDDLSSNSEYEIDGDFYETDDTGDSYNLHDRLMANSTFEMNGFTYVTDDKGRISKWTAEPRFEPENERDEKAQIEAGGNSRLEDDDGGHLVARVLGGPSGSENIVPMRSTINRGDYKKSENEIVDALKESKNVQDSGQVIYETNTYRPDKIERTYIIDGEKNVLIVENNKGFKDLLDKVDGTISKEDMQNLREEIADMEADGYEVSVTSVYQKYDESDTLTQVRIGIRNESTGEKTYKVYEPKKEI